MGEGQGLGSSEEDDNRIYGTAVDRNHGRHGAVQVNDGFQIHQQQSQNSVVCWERFLPIRSLKVLLVENDDSTRHVVSALLRNCSYEVTATANGLQAWKILEDTNNHIDIVLTEVVMPILSGIGLLSKIMSHKNLSNIPVIMMSSHDSMGIVFKCLSKGAVDFLVKPIRKNELKNLWQHVWRRCHSSSGSGSGSESGTHTKKSAKTKSNEESQNNSDSSDEFGDYGSNGPSNRSGSDDGSGTQSSWTKRTSDFDSPQPLLSTYVLGDAPDSTCAQVILAKPESFGNICAHATETKECEGNNDKDDDFSMGKDLKIGVPSNPDVQHDCQCDNLSPQPISKRQQKISEVDSKPLENGKLEHDNENTCTKLRDQTPKMASTSASSLNPHIESKTFGTSNYSDISNLKDKACCESGEMSSLELSLKRLRGAGDGGNVTNDERIVIRHSDWSAFSKYNTGSSANQVPTENVGSCSPLDNNSAAVKTETTNNVPFDLSGAVVNQQSNGSSNNNDMASTAVTPKLEALNDKSESTSAFKSFHSSAFQPVQNGRTSCPRQMIPGRPEDAGNKVHEQVRSSHKQVQVQHHHHHHHYHHHVHIQRHQLLQDHDDISLKNMAAAAPQCGSSNVFGGPTEGNAGNYSTNGSVSGSNHGSNGKNGSNTALTVKLTNIESDNTAGGNNAGGGLSGRTSGTAADEDRAAQREAALSKFRQKRKERCFEKRVRYQSRKRLAEQRPRVKGQFVRQTMSESNGGRDCQSNDLTSEDNSCDSVR